MGVCMYFGKRPKPTPAVTVQTNAAVESLLASIPRQITSPDTTDNSTATDISNNSTDNTTAAETPSTIKKRAFPSHLKL